MTSQNSTNKPTGIRFWNLVLEDLRQKTWLLALSCLGNFLLGPIALLFSFSTGYVYRPTRGYKIINGIIYYPDGTLLMTVEEYYQQLLQASTRYISQVLLIVLGVVAFAGAILVACYGFQFLFKKRMVDLYHSAPISRKKLFAVVWLDGFLIWFVPALLSVFTSFIFAAIFMKGRFLGTIFVTTLVCFLRLTVVFLIVYHCFLVAVMLSGNMINALINGCTYGLSVIGVVGTILMLMTAFYDTFYLPSQDYVMNPLYILSPLSTPIILMIQWYSNGFSLSGEYFQLIGGLVVMIANLFLALWLYLKRPSELAERGLDNKIVQIIFRCILTAIGGIMSAMVFYEIADRSIAWIVFAMFLGSAITHCVLNVVYHVNFKALLSHKIQYCIVFACSLILFFAIRFDVTGFDARIPDKNSITGANLYVSSLTDSSYYYYGSFMGYNDYDQPSPNYLNKDAAAIYKLLEACVQKDYPKGQSFLIHMKIHTKLGSYYRSYRLSYNDMELLKPFVESEEYAKTYYPLKSLRLNTPDHIVLQNSKGLSKTINDGAQMKALMEAMNKDFESHRTISDLLKTSRRFDVVFWYPTNPDTDYSIWFNGYNSNSRQQYSIPYWYENTVKLVESWYPDMPWDPSPEDATQITFDVNLEIPNGVSVHDALYAHFGYDTNGLPLDQPSKKSFDYDQNYAGAYYVAQSDDIAFLKDLAPYLIWGTYNNQVDNEYVYLGRVQLSEGRFSDGSMADCYVRYGTLPLSILKEIEAGLSLSVYHNDGYME